MQIMTRWMLLAVGATLAAPQATWANEASTERPAVLDLTERIRGTRPATPLEQALENVIVAAWQQDDAEEDDPGAEETSPPTLNAPSPEDARYEAFEEYVAESPPMESVKAALWFLATQPDNPNNPNVETTLQAEAKGLTPEQRDDLQAFRAERDQLEGASPKRRARVLEQWASQHADNSFAGSAKREAEHARGVAASAQEADRAKLSRVLVRVGVVVLVLALVAVVVAGSGT